MKRGQPRTMTARTPTGQGIDWRAFQAAGELYRGLHKKERRLWGLVAALALAVLGLSMAVVELQKSTGYVPYVLTVNEYGAVRVLGPAEERITETDLVVKGVLRSVIEGMRWISSDEQAQRAFYERASGFLGPGPQAQFQGMVEARLEQRAAGRVPPPRAVFLRSILLLSDGEQPGEGRYEAQWREVEEGRTGAHLKDWKGTFTVRRSDARDPEGGANPLGIVIETMDLSEVGDGGDATDDFERSFGLGDAWERSGRGRGE